MYMKTRRIFALFQQERIMEDKVFRSLFKNKEESKTNALYISIKIASLTPPVKNKHTTVHT